ncbi:cobalamin B12-binding domain-containing protein [Rossellomorea aquimaris]|uniref:cobalamin B12-binding domain-containing protein n=1 Tax=Rossellomorea aquimaris TaxID=189382 RepID=UPI0007D087F7|nr:cobalamin B12-binding domain-containing protein [Rossellomorea aquimaris]
MNQLVQTFTKSILTGDVHALLDFHSSSIQSKMDEINFYEKVVKPSMYRIGELWEKNQITVADEHLATATLKYLLASLYTPHVINETSPKALLFCIEGEEHSLGLEMAHEVFKTNDWNTRFLGSNVPIKDIVTFIQSWEPHTVAISIGMTTELPRLKECIQEIEKNHPKMNILIGGRLISHYTLSFLETDQITCFDDLFELNKYLADFSQQMISLKV